MLLDQLELNIQHIRGAPSAKKGVASTLLKKCLIPSIRSMHFWDEVA